jgi:phytoene dehydrogenase-like protein
VIKEDVMTGKPTLRGDFDVVVIGSGPGGLMAAALLARLEGKRVLVLERHYRLGGFTHTFERPGGFTWDVGVHYVGKEIIAPGTAANAFRVATAGALRWSPLPETFERLRFPGFEFEMRAGRENLVEDLTRAFPAEARAIRAWLADVDRAASVSPLRVMDGALPGPLRRAAWAAMSGRLALGDMSLRDYLARRFADSRLRAVVSARWGDHGLPPSQCAFLAHAIITRHYLDGALYPVGSAASIARTMGEAITGAGGQLRIRAEVEQILVRGGRAVGVRLKNGEEILAPVVISDAGARNTYLRFLPQEVPVPFRAQLAAVPPGMGFVTLYLGLSAPGSTLGVKGENLWCHRSLDHDTAWAARPSLLDGVVDNTYISFPSLKDPEATAHTAEIVAPADPASFAPWTGTRWMKRGESYEAVKERISDALLAEAEVHLPGLSRLVVHRELGTPLTTTHFTAHPAGESYGTPFLPGSLHQPWRTARTPVRGLYLAGADACFLGVTGAGMGGVAAAVAAAGVGIMPRLVRESRRLVAQASRSPVLIASRGEVRLSSGGATAGDSRPAEADRR